MWRLAKPVNIIHFNNQVRLHGLIMSIAANRHISQQSADGCTARIHVDDPVFNSKEIFQTLALQCNNDRMKVDLPPSTN